VAADAENARRMAGKTRDVRGRIVKLTDPVALYLLRQHNVVDADTLRSITNEKGVRIAFSERIALITGICGLVLVVGFFGFALLTGDIRDAPYAKSASLLYFCALPWILWYGIKRRRLNNVAEIMLKYARCPHCAYDLRFLSRDDDDGATVCPECGCAWHLEQSQG